MFEPAYLQVSIVFGLCFATFIFCVSNDDTFDWTLPALPVFHRSNVSNCNDLTAASCAAAYVPPMPLKGTGFHRYVFVLLEQNGIVDLGTKDQLRERFICTRTLMKEHKMGLKSLAFFQSTWDNTVVNTWQSESL